MSCRYTGWTFSLRVRFAHIAKILHEKGSFVVKIIISIDIFNCVKSKRQELKQYACLENGGMPFQSNCHSFCLVGVFHISLGETSQRKIAAEVVTVEAQALLAFITSEHCREHVFWQTCEIRLLLATDLNIFQWNSINKAAECRAVLSPRSHVLTVSRFLHLEAKRRMYTF